MGLPVKLLYCCPFSTRMNWYILRSLAISLKTLSEDEDVGTSWSELLHSSWGTGIFSNSHQNCLQSRHENRTEGVVDPTPKHINFSFSSTSSGSGPKKDWLVVNILLAVPRVSRALSGSISTCAMLQSLFFTFKARGTIFRNNLYRLRRKFVLSSGCLKSHASNRLALCDLVAMPSVS